MSTTEKRPKGRPRTVKDPVDRSLRLSKDDWEHLRLVTKRLGIPDGASWADRVRRLISHAKKVYGE